MKKSYRALIVFFCAMTAWGSTPFASGGVTLDFAKISVPGTQKAVVRKSRNLLNNGTFSDPETNPAHWNSRGRWGGAAYAHGGTPLQKKEVPLLAQRKVVNGAVYLCMPETVKKYRNGDQTMHISNCIAQDVDLAPSPEVRKMRVKIRAKGRQIAVKQIPSLFRISINTYFLNRAKRQTPAGKMVYKNFPLKNDWQEMSFDFMLPANAQRVSVSLPLYGVGECYIDDAELFFMQNEKEVEPYAYPAALLDNLFQMIPERPAMMGFVFRNDTGRKLDKSKLELHLELPEGFRLINAHTSVPMTFHADTRKAVLDITKIRSVIEGGRFSTWLNCPVLISTSRKPGPARYGMRYYLVENGITGQAKTLDLQVTHPEPSAAPVLFKSASMFTHGTNFKGPGVKEYAAAYKAQGFNAVHCSPDAAEMLAAFKHAGIERFIQRVIVNGYRLLGVKPCDGEYFLTANGKRFNHESICPSALYREGRTFRERILPELKRYLLDDDTADSFMCNWEPYHYDFKGCFCSLCKEEFIRYMAKRAARHEIEKRWPEKIPAYYGADWCAFRSMQCGKIVKLMQKHISAIGKQKGKKSYFIPEQCWDTFGKNAPNMQFDPRYYASDIPWIEPWGPYIFHNVLEPYVYYPGIHLITHFAAAQARKQIDKAKIIAFPHGNQIDTWFTEPEAVGFEFLTFFVNGWNGAFGYFYPRGYDYRYLRSTAEANRIIARYETIVLNGKAADNRAEVTPVTPLPTPIFPEYWNEGGNFKEKLPQLKKASILQMRVWQKEETLLACIGNFWQKGEAFFRIRFPGLQDKKFYDVTSEQFSYGRFSGADLKKGILAHAGALRWCMICIKPAAEQPLKNVISQKSIQDLMKQRLPGIRKQYRQEETYRKEFQRQLAMENPQNDLKSFYPVANTDVSVKVKDDKLHVTAKKYSLDVDPSKGAVISSMQSADGSALCFPGEGMLFDAFWLPTAARIQSTYKIVGSGRINGGIQLEFERRLTKKDHKDLAGLILKRKMIFEHNKITVQTTVHNPAAASVVFSFRYQSFPPFLGAKNGANGSLRLGGKVHPRDYLVMMHRLCKADVRFERPYRIKHAVDHGTYLDAEFSAPWSKTRVQCSASGDIPLYGYVVWDGNVPCPTFESIFKLKKLEGGKHAVFRSALTIN